MKQYQRILIVAAAVAGGVGIGLHAINKTEFGSAVKTRLSRLNPISQEAMRTMSEEVAMRTAQATHNPKINQAWTERQWEELGY